MIKFNIEQIKKDNLKRILDERNLKPTKFALILEVSPSYVTYLLKPVGDSASRNLGQRTISKICDKLKIDPSEFYRFPDSKNNNSPGPALAITGDYPLIKKLIGEVEDAARLGLSEEEVLNILVKMLEVEQIKRRRRPIPEPQPEYEAESRLVTIVRDILEKETPPQDLKERRKCMIDLANYLGFPPGNTKSIQLP